MNLFIDERVCHKFRGEGIYTEQCDFLQKQNSDPSSIYLEFDGEILEVTINLIKKYEQSGNN